MLRQLLGNVTVAILRNSVVAKTPERGFALPTVIIRMDGYFPPRAFIYQSIRARTNNRIPSSGGRRKRWMHL